MNMKEYQGIIKNIGFSVTANGSLVLTGKSIGHMVYDGLSMHTSAVQLIKYFTDGVAIIETENSIYEVKGKDWELIRFLYESGSYRDKCQWEFIQR